MEEKTGWERWRLRIKLSAWAWAPFAASDVLDSIPARQLRARR
jgi:hypothetical protein